MNLIDSSGWLEFFTDGSNADFFANPILDDDTDIVVSTIVIYELFKKISLERDEDSALDIVGQLKRHKVVAPDEDLSLAAAKNSIRFNLPMADSLIYTTARQFEAVLWTQDRDFEGLSSVRFIEKTE